MHIQDNELYEIKNTLSKSIKQNRELKNKLDDLKEQGEAMYATLDKNNLIPEAKQYIVFLSFIFPITLFFLMHLNM